MLDKNFVYDKENHLGYWKGKLIPSVTQLLAIEYPLDKVPEDRLKNKGILGTIKHEELEMVNKGIEEPKGREARNYALYLEKFHLEPIMSEKTVFIRDEQGEVIAYGTLDCVLLAVEDSILANKGQSLLADYKFVSQFDNVKVAKQVSIYKYGLVCEDMVVNKLVGFWFNEDKLQIRPLNELTNTLEYVKNLVGKWREQNERVD